MARAKLKHTSNYHTNHARVQMGNRAWKRTINYQQLTLLQYLQDRTREISDATSFVFLSGSNYKTFFQIKEEKLGMGEKVTVVV